MTALIEKVTVPEGKRGPWTIERFTMSKMDCAFAAFSARGRTPRGGEYTRLLHERRGLVMSDTEAEMRDHYSAVLNAKGHVLISGLGIGMVLGAILRRPHVERVTVIEIDADLIALVSPHYECPRLEIVQADVFQWSPPKGARYGAVWHDVWDEICGDNKKSMMTLRRRYGRRADWVDCWARYETYRAAV